METKKQEALKFFREVDKMDNKQNYVNKSLIEIYTTSEEHFSVGTIINETEENIFFKLFDEQGKEDGFYLFKKSCILSMKYDTSYLKKIALYIEYWEKNKTEKKLENTFYYSCPDFLELLDYAEENEEIVTISTNLKEEFLITGYIKFCNENEVEIECIDIETAIPYEIISILKKDIVYFEIESIDNKLLKYANKTITNQIS